MNKDVVIVERRVPLKQAALEESERTGCSLQTAYARFASGLYFPLARVFKTNSRVAAVVFYDVVSKR